MYLNDLHEKEIEEIVISLGMKKFRADQIFRAINIKNIKSIDDLSQLSKNERESLKASHSIQPMEILEVFGMENFKVMVLLLLLQHLIYLEQQMA